MFGSVVLEVAIGLSFVYLILSLICSIVQELIARIFALRSNVLHEGIKNLLEDPVLQNTAEKVYQHPLVRNLAKEGKKPSYIPARTFTIALLDVLKDPKASGGPLSEAQKTVSNLPSGRLRDTLSVLVADTGNQIEAVRKNLENWFDESMNRVTGWYKRKTQIISLVIAFVLAIGLNVDSAKIVAVLWSNPTLRAEYVTLAEQQTSQDFTDFQTKQLSELSGQLKSLPIGWSTGSESDTYSKADLSLVSILGWILTALAVSLGAHFWFDALGKFVNLRSAGQVPKISKS